MLRLPPFLAGFLMPLLLITACAKGARPDLVYRLPTNNIELFRNNPKGFYMYVDRTFEGKTTRPWQGGAYGMVRNPFRASATRVMYSRFHEGIDVSPVRRDENDEPLDIVRPIAPGRVVHVNDAPGASNYGRYIVVAHYVPEGIIFSLYAHLASVDCRVGQRVGTGNKLGVLGYSGVGLNKRRAHLHLEIGLMIHSEYEKFGPKDNEHGNYNGLNLIGFDPSKVLKHCRTGEPLSISRYFATLKEHYRVRVPCIGTMDLLRRHPFLYKGSFKQRPAALDMAFTAEGVPIAVYPASQSVEEPVIISCAPKPTQQQNCTVNRVKNSSRDAELTESGKRYITQYLWIEGRYGPQPQKEENTEQPTPENS